MGVSTRQDDDQAGAGIAILGGSFDPPHCSHLRLAGEALSQLPVTSVLVIPAGDHPHKQDSGMTGAEHRLAMCRLAFGELPAVTVDDREIRRSGRSFTADTLAELAAEHAGRPLFFLIGSDNLPLLPSWREHHRILALATIVTWPRTGYPIDPERLHTLDLTPAERRKLLAHVLQLPADAVAATDLRARLAAGSPTPELAPAVAEYAATHALYRAR
ncbi:MAG: nicotinate (nicotinamide) nucleotide adenylyltransferase [bacterium]|nr:nicotinate (nicotinamide) nucleotide adenylyltransferase [bacterium]